MYYTVINTKKIPILPSNLSVIQTDIKNISEEHLLWGASLFDSTGKRYRITA